MRTISAIPRSATAVAFASLLFVLPFVPNGAANEPYVFTYEYQGHIGYSVGWHAEVPGEGCMQGPLGIGYDKTCGGTRSGDSFGEVATNITADVQTIIVEIEWDPTISEARLMLDTLCDEVPRGPSGAVLDTEHPCYYRTSGDSPLRIRIDADDWAGGEYDPVGDWATRVFAAPQTVGSDEDGLGAGVVYDQPFTLYITTFHGLTAPDGYTAIP